jgi:hypothetical protein
VRGSTIAANFMKTSHWTKLVAGMVSTGLILSGSSVLAQDSVPATSVQTALVNTAAPQLPYGASQILKLKEAGIGDDTILAFIKNSANRYEINADQIIYLKKQAVSDAVLIAMLQQPKAKSTAAFPTSPAPAYAAQVPTATPTVAYVQSYPAPTYYYQPYYYPSYGYGYYSPVVYTIGAGNCWYGGHWHGGSYCYGGGHGGGCYGGWHGGGSGGGWHGGAAIGRGVVYAGGGHGGIHR